MIVDCVSDLHGYFPKLEGGDLLIVAGDLTACDLGHQYRLFLDWLENQNYTKKIVIAGNHDGLLEGRRWTIAPPDENFTYLCDSGTEFEGLKIWGSPWTTTFPGMNPHCKAFTVDTEEELADKFEIIPPDTDILITHSPAKFIRDKTVDGRNVGSGYLYGWLKYVGRPKIHIHGHIHEAYGQTEYFSSCQSINCSHVNERYEPVNKPIRIIL